MRKLHAWIVAAFAFAEIAAGTDRPAKARPPDAFGHASWYGWFHEGRLSANGRRFHALAETAASLTLPLGTWIRVTNLANGRSLVVEVTDRGPYIRGRILDVSLGTARKLGMVHSGVVRVKIEVVERADRRS